MDDPAALERQLPRARFLEVRRYGKFLALVLQPAKETTDGASRLYFFIHLGMTGQIVAAHPAEPLAPHTHLHLALDDGREMRYTDIRRFGRMLLLPGNEVDAFVARLGLEPLDMDEADFRARLAGRRAMIKALLLDQRVFRGLGNIYTDESLYRAHIHPRRLAANLRDAELRALYRAIRGVLAEAIRRRGTSISDYVDSDGQRGDFQRRLRAYGREGKPCTRCEARIRRVIVAGRSSYFCPCCQRPGRRTRPASRAVAETSPQTKRIRKAPAPHKTAA
jgi:formamidopyrimidine-DNA glycosylase